MNPYLKWVTQSSNEWQSLDKDEIEPVTMTAKWCDLLTLSQSKFRQRFGAKHVISLYICLKRNEKVWSSLKYVTNHKWNKRNAMLYYQVRWFTIIKLIAWNCIISPVQRMKPWRIWVTFLISKHIKTYKTRYISVWPWEYTIIYRILNADSCFWLANSRDG